MPDPKQDPKPTLGKFGNCTVPTDPDRDSGKKVRFGSGQKDPVPKHCFKGTINEFFCTMQAKKEICIILIIYLLIQYLSDPDSTCIVIVQDRKMS